MKNTASIKFLNYNRSNTDLSDIYEYIVEPYIIYLDEQILEEYFDALELWLDEYTEDMWMWRITGHVVIHHHNMYYVTSAKSITTLQSTINTTYTSASATFWEPMRVYEMYFESESDALMFSLRWM